MSQPEVIDQIMSGRRLDAAEALSLWDLDLLTLGRLADLARRRLHPEPVVTYVVDRNINYTNICTSGCKFCAFYRSPGDPGGYVLDRDSLRKKLVETVSARGTGILLQGGLNPDLPLDFYEGLVEFIRGFGLQVHGFSPPEISFLSRLSGLPVNEILARLMAAGLSSIPGGGAEILSDRVRRAISPNKCTAGEWLEVMRTAHALGLKTTATMMFGHLETRAERLEHLMRLRDLQDQTAGFTAFIPWTFQPGGTALGGEPAGALEYLKTLAVSRLVLDNFPNLQVSWVTQGAKIAQVALQFGANDFGSTMLEENVVAATGVTFRLCREEIVRLITAAGYSPQQRDHVYRLVGRGGQGPTAPSSSPKPPPPTLYSRLGGGSGGRAGRSSPWPSPHNSPSPHFAIIARVGAHRDFLARGVEYRGEQRPGTPFGEANPVHTFVHDGVEFAVLSRHGEDGYRMSAPFVNDRANLYALKALGVEKILAWCAPGAVNEAMAPGHLAVPHDILDEGKGGPHTFFPGRGQGFIRHNPVFCPAMRQALMEGLADGPFKLHTKAVYVGTTGPRLETPAEIRKFAILGGDLVGQTLVPEVFLARELEFCYAALCYVVNFAEGVKDRPYEPGVLFEGLATAAEMERVRQVEAAFVDIALKLLPALAATERACPCPLLMERYRRRGDLGEDWRTWFP
jgi:dehypoxanthine futalosine cyclase